MTPAAVATSTTKKMKKEKSLEEKLRPNPCDPGPNHLVQKLAKRRWCGLACHHHQLRVSHALAFVSASRVAPPSPASPSLRNWCRLPPARHVTMRARHTPAERRLGDGRVLVGGAGGVVEVQAVRLTLRQHPQPPSPPVPPTPTPAPPLSARRRGRALLSWCGSRAWLPPLGPSRHGAGRPHGRPRCSRDAHSRTNLKDFHKEIN